MAQKKEELRRELLTIEFADSIPMRKIADITADFYALGDVPRHEIIELLQQLWKQNGTVFFASQLSWFKILTTRKTYH